MVILLAGTIFGAPSAQPNERADQRDDKQINLDELIMLNPNEIYLSGADCQDNEKVVLGMLPECEPTCENPRPICPRIFTVLDKPFCFCKDPLVRHTKSNLCMKLDECEQYTKMYNSSSI